MKKPKKDKEQEDKIRVIIIEALMEINGGEGKEGILDILDDSGTEMNRQEFQKKDTTWLLDTWEAALEEVAKIVGNKEYENQLDFKEKD